ncbi:MAG: hypothetical protein LH629_07790, partial [Ignavibacteria bacterium]|nr:hypothetical protein [Ignavibacteria bacterium]
MKRIYQLNNVAKVLSRSSRVCFFVFATLMSSLLFINNANATHAAGADISYKWISGNTYKVTVSFYRDCAGNAAPTTISISVKSASLGSSFAQVLAKVSGTGQEITFPCGGVTNCNSPGSLISGLQRYEYSGNVTLPGPATDWVFGYQICCRNCNISTIVHPSPCNSLNTDPQLYVEATLNSVIAPTN